MVTISTTEEEEQMMSGISLDSLLIADGESPKLTLKFPNCMNGEIVKVMLSLEEMTPTSLKKCILKNHGICFDGKKLYSALLKEYGRQAMKKLCRFLSTIKN